MVQAYCSGYYLGTGTLCFFWSLLCYAQVLSFVSIMLMPQHLLCLHYAQKDSTCIQKLHLNWIDPALSIVSSNDQMSSSSITSTCVQIKGHFDHKFTNYAGIMLTALRGLLCSKQCQHNVLVPTTTLKEGSWVFKVLVAKILQNPVQEKLYNFDHFGAIPQLTPKILCTKKSETGVHFCDPYAVVNTVAFWGRTGLDIQVGCSVSIITLPAATPPARCSQQTLDLV